MRSLPSFRSRSLTPKMQQLSDALIKVPSTQKHVRKFDLLLPTDHLDEYFKTIGFPPPTPLVVFRAECDSPDHIAEVFSDPEFQRAFVGSAEFDLPKGNWFATDVVTRQFHSEASTGKPGVHGIMIVKVPPNIAIEQFREQLLAAHDAYFALPGAQKALRTHTVASPNDSMNAHIRTAGLTVAEATFIVYFEAESVEGIMEVAAKADMAKHVETEMKDRGSHVDNCGFGVNVVTKIA
ncbi:hypothetical protein MSAN_01950300 [Mycena sanguinolenta]|uniref:Uncharacterized protein n=1 Tax=Mycena sanguinolenta TaxID=230812 RepID=A0A8H6XNL7_9AGAR|nr:hypothetical protein MSAN_01950300 [Mycena sanguinolenta]